MQNRGRALAVTHARFPGSHPCFPDALRRPWRRHDVCRDPYPAPQLIPTMFGSEYNWLVTPVRSARGLTVRLVRNSLLTLGVGAFCLSCALLPYRAPHAPVAGVAAPAANTIKETAQS